MNIKKLQKEISIAKKGWRDILKNALIVTMIITMGSFYYLEMVSSYTIQGLELFWIFFGALVVSFIYYYSRSMKAYTLIGKILEDEYFHAGQLEDLKTIVNRAITEYGFTDNEFDVFVKGELKKATKQREEDKAKKEKEKDAVLEEARKHLK